MLVQLALAAYGHSDAQAPDAAAADAAAVDALPLAADAALDADPTGCHPVNTTVLDPAVAGIPTAGLVVWLRADASISATAAGDVCS